MCSFSRWEVAVSWTSSRRVTASCYLPSILLSCSCTSILVYQRISFSLSTSSFRLVILGNFYSILSLDSRIWSLYLINTCILSDRFSLESCASNSFSASSFLYCSKLCTFFSNSTTLFLYDRSTVWLTNMFWINSSCTCSIFLPCAIISSWLLIWLPRTSFYFINVSILSCFNNFALFSLNNVSFYFIRSSKSNFADVVQFS